jgi:ADP-ribosylarginine hydrolase
MAIGLRYSQASDFDSLMRISIDISRMTHTHVYGYLGGFTSALFTAYAIQEKPIRTWIKSLVDILPDVQRYIQSEMRPDWTQTMRHW